MTLVKILLTHLELTLAKIIFRPGALAEIFTFRPEDDNGKNYF
jgi:hypothetical protein